MLRRLIKATAYACVGNLLGTASGFLLGLHTSGPQSGNADEGKLDAPNEQAKRKRKRDHLLGHVQQYGLLRKVVESALPSLSNLEYQARRQLEAMGYYPCSKCRVPHLEGGEIDCLPLGAYFSEALDRYIAPDHRDWRKDEYEEATGQKWGEQPDEDLPH